VKLSHHRKKRRVAIFLPQNEFPRPLGPRLRGDDNEG
jgi:hypothetical protein